MVLHDGKNNQGFCDCQDNISGGNGLLQNLSNKTNMLFSKYPQTEKAMNKNSNGDLRVHCPFPDPQFQKS